MNDIKNEVFDDPDMEIHYYVDDVRIYTNGLYKNMMKNIKKVYESYGL